MTASRARNSDIGSEREKSRIGTRGAADAPAAPEPKRTDDGWTGFLAGFLAGFLVNFFRAMAGQVLRFALQHAAIRIAPNHLTC
jgi:hypothetical protein